MRLISLALVFMVGCTNSDKKDTPDVVDTTIAEVTEDTTVTPPDVAEVTEDTAVEPADVPVPQDLPPEVVDPVCGNDRLETGELCDDGNLDDHDGCDSTCRPTGCDSGVFSPGEICYGPPQTIRLSDQPQGVALGDFDGDGFLDAAVTSNATKIFILRGDGTGALVLDTTLSALAGFSSDIKAVDLDKDDDLDLIVSGSDGSHPGKISIFLNTGDGTFAAPTGIATGFFLRDVSVADINGDTHLDLVTVAQNSGAIQRFIAAGDGTFTTKPDVTLSGVNRLITADFNGDTFPDVMAHVVGDANLYYYPTNDDGSGDFVTKTPVPTGSKVVTLVPYDFDDDARMDIAVTGRGTVDAISLMKGAGDGTFTVMGSVTVGGDSTQLRVADLNGDGNVELIQLSYTARQYFIAPGKGGFTFETPLTITATFPAGFDIGDLNGDGFLDLVLADQDGSVDVSLFRP